MFDFHFVYSTGITYDVQNVNKIIIAKPSSANQGSVEIEGDEILSARIPLKSMCLYSDDGNFTVSGTDLIIIDVKKN